MITTETLDNRVISGWGRVHSEIVAFTTLSTPTRWRIDIDRPSYASSLSVGAQVMVMQGTDRYFGTITALSVTSGNARITILPDKIYSSAMTAPDTLYSSLPRTASAVGEIDLGASTSNVITGFRPSIVEFTVLPTDSTSIAFYSKGVSVGDHYHRAFCTAITSSNRARRTATSNSILVITATNTIVGLGRVTDLSDTGFTVSMSTTQSGWSALYIARA